MRVEIIGLSQELDLRDGTMKNVLRLQFLDNTQVQVVVNDDLVLKVTELFAKDGGAALARVLENAGPASEHDQEFVQPAQQMVLDGDGNEEFGGNYGEEPEQAEDLYEERQAPVLERTRPLREGPPRTRPLQVSADERGNPVITGRNVQETEAILGGRGADEEEDGVGSI